MRTLNVEGVLHLSSRMLLRNEHGIEVPEGRLDELIRRHLGETECSIRDRVSTSSAKAHTPCQRKWS